MAGTSYAVSTGMAAGAAGGGGGASRGTVSVRTFSVARRGVDQRTSVWSANRHGIRAIKSVSSCSPLNFKVLLNDTTPLESGRSICY